MARRRIYRSLGGKTWFGLFLVILLAGMARLEPSAIEQFDSDYQILGFEVSRGKNHELEVRTETLSFAGLKLSRTAMQLPGSGAGSNQTASAVDQLPARIAGSLQKVGLRPNLITSSSVMAYQDLKDSTVFYVRFSGKGKADNFESIDAFLTEQGGMISRLSLNTLGQRTGQNECVVSWVKPGAMPPNPSDHFKLLLYSGTNQIGIIRLGAVRKD